jgi:hypothetical protein
VFLPWRPIWQRWLRPQRTSRAVGFRGFCAKWTRLISTTSERRRFPPPWSVDEQPESFVVTDVAGQPLAHVYFKDGPQQRQMSMKRLSRDAAQ